MKRINIKQTRNILTNEAYEALPLEMELVKVTQEKTPIESISPEIFTERKDGVRPEYDIRTDKWDIAHEAMSKVAEARILRMNQTPDQKESETNNGAKSTNDNKTSS